MSAIVRKALAVAGLAVLCASAGAESFAISANLSRDTMTRGDGPNPDFLFVEMANLHNEAFYTALPVYEPVCSIPGQARCWRAAGGTPYVAVSSAGVVTLHPGPTQAVMVRWKSAVGGQTKLLAHIADTDGACGDGVAWHVDTGPFTAVSGELNNKGGGASRVVSKTFNNLGPTESVYFIVAPGTKQDGGCDATSVDALLTEKFY